MARESSFIDYLCQHIRQFDLNRTDLHVVLPSIRLERVLTRRLVRMAEQENRLPCWLPRFETIDRLVAGFSGLRKADSTESVVMLYECYCQVYRQQGEEPLSFDRFREWGRMLVSDFNQIDNQLAPADEILHYIAEDKRIGAWHLDLDESAGKLQNAYLKFYQKLGDIYALFTRKLLENGCAYTGLAGKTACGHIDTEADRLSPHTFYLFAGLNALTAAEEKIIKTLIRRQKAEILWNADRYYLIDNLEHEAGHFLRRYSRDKDLNHHLKEEDLTDRIRRTRIEIIACPQHTGQAKTVAKLLDLLPDAGDIAVVLNDESLFGAVMNALPPRFPCNVTLAGTLSGTLSGALFTTLLRAREGVCLNKKSRIAAPVLLALLRNPLFERLTGGQTPMHTGKGKSANTRHMEAILAGHRLYFSEPEFRAFFPHNPPAVDPLAAFIFEGGKAQSPNENREDPVRAIGHFRQIALLLLDSTCHKNQSKPQQTRLFNDTDAGIGTPLNPFEQNYLLRLENACRESMETWKRFSHIPIGCSTLSAIFSEILSGIGLNYTGEQENNLNVMGMLETRGMHFRHTFLLSMNEGILPAPPAKDSFLLHSIKEHYNIPTETEQTAMQAHHFYSLLQDCEQVTLLYTASESDKNVEKSRFLLQLEHELPQNITLREENTYAFPLRNIRYSSEHELRIAKSPLVLDALKSRLAKGISYSSLSCWLQCPAKFFFKYIMGLGEPPQVSDELAPNIKGSVFHSAMQTFFEEKDPHGQNRLNRPLTRKDVESLRQEKESLLQAAIRKEFPGGHYDHGQNLLAYREIEIWMDRYAAAWEAEMETGKLSVLECEKSFDADLSCLIPGLKLRLNGFADRIDLYTPAAGESGNPEPYLRIIDYKTGTVGNLSPEGFAELTEPDGAQALQLLLYIYLYRLAYPTDPRPVRACICSLRNKGRMSALEGPLVENVSPAQLMADTESFIKESVIQMLDPDLPVRCTDKPENCRHCHYLAFCRNRDTEQE